MGRGPRWVATSARLAPGRGSVCCKLRGDSAGLGEGCRAEGGPGGGRTRSWGQKGLPVGAQVWGQRLPGRA